MFHETSGRSDFDPIDEKRGLNKMQETKRELQCLLRIKKLKQTRGQQTNRKRKTETAEENCKKTKT